MAKQLRSRTILLAKNGGAPSSTDVVNITSLSLSFETKGGDFKEMRGFQGGKQNYKVKDYRLASGTIETMLRSNGGGSALPKLTELFLMCGLQYSQDDTNNLVTFTPKTGEVGTGTLVRYMDDEKETIENVTLNLKFDFEVGYPIKASFDFKGFAQMPQVENNPTDITLDTNDLFIVDGISVVTLSGAVLNMTKASFDLGNSLQEIYATGLKEIYREDYEPTLTIEDIKVKGDNAHWSDLLAGNIKSVSIKLQSADGSSSFEFNAPKCRYIDVSEDDVNGATGLSRKFALEAVSGDENFSFTYK